MPTGTTSGVGKHNSIVTSHVVDTKEQVEAVGKIANAHKGQDVTEKDTSALTTSNATSGQEVVDNYETLSDRIKEVEKYVQSSQRDLRFDIDEQTGDMMVKVYDSKTDELIRQIPSEEMMHVKKTQAQVGGMLLNIKV